MNEVTQEEKTGFLRRRYLEILFWVVLVAALWSLDTLTQITIRDRTGAGLDDFRLIAEQSTSALGVLVMIGFVSWWTRHFPIRRTALPMTVVGHLAGSIVFSLGHYAVQIGLRVIIYPIFGNIYSSPSSLVANLVFEYQKDVKIYVGIVVVITMYRLFLGGENRLQVRPRSANKMLVQTGSGEAIVAYDQIEYLESARNYVVVHSSDREFIVRNSMTGLLESLATDDFVRTHRSYAVNLDKVTEIRGSDSGHIILTAGGGKIPLSRSYRDAFKSRFES